MADAETARNLRRAIPSLNDIRPGGNGKCLQAGIVALLVGPRKERFVAHKNVLCQSLVLAAMCLTDCKEHRDNIMVFPEDDPEDFRLLLAYLYSGGYLTAKEEEWASGTLGFEDDPGFEAEDDIDCDEPLQLEETAGKIEASLTGSFQLVDLKDTEYGEDDGSRGSDDLQDDCNRTTIPQEDSEFPEDIPRSAMDKLAEWEFELALEHMRVYLIAEKYDLRELKVLAQVKMLGHMYLESNPTDLLNLAAAVYPHIAAGDDVFRPYFKYHIPIIFAWIAELGMVDSQMVFNEYLEEGGMFAEDLSESFRNIGKDGLSLKARIYLDCRGRSFW